MAKISSQRSWSLSTEDTELRIELIDDAVAVTALRSTGARWDWAGEPIRVPIPSIQGSGTDGRQVQWKFTGASREDEDGSVVVLTHEVAGEALRLRSFWRAYPGPGPVECWQELVNDTDRGQDLMDTAFLVRLTEGPYTSELIFIQPEEERLSP